MLVGLVLFLTASLGGMAYLIQSLSDRVDDLTVSQLRLRSQLDRAVSQLEERAVDAEGKFAISEEEIAYAIQLQKQVDRHRRLGGMVRSVMRRIDYMLKRGELAAMEEEERSKVDNVVSKYMTESDDLMTHYFREPGPNVREMEATARRALLKTEREQLQTEAAAEINQLLSDDRGTKIAEAMFYRNWSNRRESK